MQGKKNIIDDILSSAKKTAATMIADAESEKAEARKAVDASIEQFTNSAKAEADEAASAAKSGKLKLGELEAGKIMLGYKRACVDDVYSAVRAKVLAMKDGEYLDFLAKLIGANATDGDEIVAAARDKKRVTAAWVKKLSGSLKVKLTLAAENGDFEAGVVLRNAEYDRDLTIDEIISDLKDRTEADTVKSLAL